MTAVLKGTLASLPPLAVPCAPAMATLTPASPAHVTPQMEHAFSASTTPPETSVSGVLQGFLGMPHNRTARVSQSKWFMTSPLSVGGMWYAKYTDILLSVIANDAL